MSVRVYSITDLPIITPQQATEIVAWARARISNFNCNMDLLHNLISKLKVKLYMKANILNL